MNDNNQSNLILKFPHRKYINLSSIFSLLPNYKVINLSKMDLSNYDENNLLYILKQKNIEYVDITNTIFARIEYTDFFKKLEEEYLIKLIIFLPKWLFTGSIDYIIPEKHREKVMKRHIEYYNSIDCSD